MKPMFVALCLMLETGTPYKKWLDEEDRRRRDRRIPRCALRTFFYSSFYHLYQSRNDQALLNATGHDFNSFDSLLTLFSPIYYFWTYDDEFKVIREKVLDKNGWPKGKPRDMPACGCLGLILMWFRTRASCARGLALAFGQTSTPLYKWLKFGRRVLLHVLSRHDAAKVRPPTAAEFKSFKEAVVDKYPACPNVWGAADGLKLLIEAPYSYSKQLRYYNGWKAGHFVNCVFVFSVDGKIRLCVLNAPGCFHDSHMADYGLYHHLERIFEETGGQVVVDSAFRVEKGPYLIKLSQTDPMDPDELLVNRDATSIRQLSGWGMRIIQSSFPRLKEPLRFEEDGDRFIILRLMVNLYNYQTEMMGQNQIFNSYMASQGNYFDYDSIDEYYNL